MSILKSCKNGVLGVGGEWLGFLLLSQQALLFCSGNGLDAAMDI
jgi:hypothetical protein